jgi:hypothetical protein
MLLVPEIAASFPERSHFWKLRRAHQHLTELDALLSRYSERNPYEVVRDDSASRPGLIMWRAHVAEQPGPEVSVVVGDVVHNLRSALDHVAVAVAPRNRRRSAGFPILHENIWAQDETGAFVNGDDEKRRSYQSKLKGMPPAAVAAIERSQPYNNPDPKHNLLYLLSILENADKHVELTPITTGLTDYDIILFPQGDRSQGYISERQPGPIKNGAEIPLNTHATKTPWGDLPIDDEKVLLSLVGSVQVDIRLSGFEGSGQFEIVEMLPHMWINVWSWVDELDALIPDVEPPALRFPDPPLPPEWISH